MNSNDAFHFYTNGVKDAATMIAIAEDDVATLEV